MHVRRTGLWRHADFLKLWTGLTVSRFGDQISILALPLTAALMLHATPVQMGMLAAASTLPSLLLGLLVGAWIDRRSRRPVLLTADIGRAILLAFVPVAALVGSLRIELLYVVAFLVGLLNLMFDIANRAFLTTLVRHDALVEANSRLELSRSAAEIAGPGLAGGLVQVATAPGAVALDAVSFVISAILIRRIHTIEPAPDAAGQRHRLRTEIAEGVRLVIRQALLRSLAGGTGTLSLFSSMLEAAFILYLLRNLGITPAILGFVFAAGNVGFLLGAVFPDRISTRVGVGPTMVAGIILIGLGDLTVPLAGGPLPLVIAALIAAHFLFGLGSTLYNINQVSLRQTITPLRLQGRMNATFRFVATGIAPVGALLGGVLGEVVGLRTTLLVAAIGELSAVLWLCFSPVRTLRAYPVSISPADPSSEGQ